MNRLLVILAAALLMAGCSSKDSITIKGTVPRGAKKTIYLSRVDIDTPVLIDSAKVSKSGAFSLRVKASYPDFYQLGFSSSDFITLLAEPGEKIELKFTGNTLFQNYTVTGSEGTAKVKYLDEILEKTKNSLDSLSKAYKEASLKPDFAVTGPALEAAYTSLVAGQRSKTIEFIIANTTSLASIKAIYQKITPEAYVLYDPKDLQFLKIVTDSLKAKYPDSKHVQALERDFQKELGQMYASRLEQLTRDIPATKLDPDLMDVDGKRVSLSSLKGKYVLLTFWSFRSAECVSENLGLKELYKKYNRKGFEIYQINLDENEADWKKAVRFDELPWISTREDDPLSPKYANMFNVKSLPTNYLFDTEGDIIAVNLHGKQLEIKLEQLFN